MFQNHFPDIFGQVTTESFFNVHDWVIFVEDNLHLGTPENTWAVNQAPPPSGDQSAPLDAAQGKILEYELLDFIWQPEYQPFLHKPGHWRHGRFIVIVELNKLIDFSYRSII